MPAKKATPVVAKPTYAVMVHESIKALGDRTGSSVQAISKQLRAQYHVEMINKYALSKAIKKGVESGDLVQIKASYKINKKPAAPVTKPTKPKKTTEVKKKVVAKKDTAKKKAATSTKKTTKASSMKPKKAIAKKPTRKASTKTSTKSSTTSTKKAASTTTKKTSKRTTATSRRAKK